MGHLRPSSTFLIYANPFGDPIDPATFDPLKVPIEKLKGARGAGPLTGKIRMGLMTHGVDVMGAPGGFVSATHGGAEIEKTVHALAPDRPCAEGRTRSEGGLAAFTLRASFLQRPSPPRIAGEGGRPRKAMRESGGSDLDVAGWLRPIRHLTLPLRKRGSPPSPPARAPGGTTKMSPGRTRLMYGMTKPVPATEFTRLPDKFRKPRAHRVGRYQCRGAAARLLPRRAELRSGRQSLRHRHSVRRASSASAPRASGRW